MLAVDNASVRLARSHVHTGFAERLHEEQRADGRRAFPTLWGKPWDACPACSAKPMKFQSLTERVSLTLPEDD